MARPASSAPQPFAHRPCTTSGLQALYMSSIAGGPVVMLIDALGTALPETARIDRRHMQPAQGRGVAETIHIPRGIPLESSAEGRGVRAEAHRVEPRVLVEDGAAVADAVADSSREEPCFADASRARLAVVGDRDVVVELVDDAVAVEVGFDDRRGRAITTPGFLGVAMAMRRAYGSRGNHPRTPEAGRTPRQPTLDRRAIGASPRRQPPRLRNRA